MVEKRLDLIHPWKHELKLTSEAEMCMVILSLNLENLPWPAGKTVGSHIIEKEW